MYMLSLATHSNWTSPATNASAEVRRAGVGHPTAEQKPRQGDRRSRLGVELPLAGLTPDDETQEGSRANHKSPGVKSLSRTLRKVSGPLKARMTRARWNTEARSNGRSNW